MQVQRDRTLQRHHACGLLGRQGNSAGRLQSAGHIPRFVHSEKGRSLLEGCKDQLQLQPAAKDAFAFNPAVLAPIQKPARYDEFWEGYGQTAFADLVSACCEPTKEELAQERRSKSLLARVMRRLKR